MPDVLLFDNGYINSDLIGTFTQTKAYSNSAGEVTVSNTIRVTAFTKDGSSTSLSNMRIGASTKAIDLTEIRSLMFTVTKAAGTAGVTIASNRYATTNYNTLTNPSDGLYSPLSVGEIEVDVSDLSGEHYINLWVFGNQGASVNVYISKIGTRPMNDPPTDPSGLSYADPTAGRQMGITWNASTDPDGDAITYVAELKEDSEVYAEIGQTTGTNFPVYLSAAIYPGNEIPISWTAAEGADGYAIQRSIDNGATWADLATITGGDVTTYTDTAPSGTGTVPAKGGNLLQVKYRIASTQNGAVVSDYTESGAVNVYIRGDN